MHFIAFDQPLLKLKHSITKKMQTVVCMMHEVTVIVFPVVILVSDQPLGKLHDS